MSGFLEKPETERGNHEEESTFEGSEYASMTSSVSRPNTTQTRPGTSHTITMESTIEGDGTHRSVDMSSRGTTEPKFGGGGAPHMSCSYDLVVVDQTHGTAQENAQTICTS